MNNVHSLTPAREPNIRIATLADLSAIVNIYNQAVPTHRSTANTSPVTVEGRQAWFLEHEPDKHPIFVAEIDGKVAGWCSLSIYRPGRFALRFTVEISYYIVTTHQRKGIGNILMRHATNVYPSLSIKNLIAVVIDRNIPSQKLLKKFGFQQWGYLPRVLDFGGQEFGEFYYGKRVSE